MDITINTIPHAEQRYETVGDWQFDVAGNLEIHVSDMGNWKYEALVAIHELTEALLCNALGITAAMVDAFDQKFEETRDDFNDMEPGEHPAAPYRREHFFATTVERLLSAEFGVDWTEYGDAVEAL